MLTLQITSPTELSIEISSGNRFPIHPLWLRERCQDAKSVDLRTGQRLEDPSDVDLQLGLTAVSEVEPGRYRIRFSDGHEADFLAREIIAEADLPAGDHDCPPVRLWDGTLTAIPRLAWSSTPTDEQRTAWLRPFLELGFVIFAGVPTEPKQVLKVGGTFGYVRDTNFGAYFDVRSVPDANDLAYTSLFLDPHTDNPYRSPVPGVQLLHCLANETSGGMSTLVDGFAAAQTLRCSDPEAFRVLSQTPVRFRFLDVDTELVRSSSLIEVDGVGGLQAINFSPRLDYVPLLPPAELTAYFKARKQLDALLRSPQYEIRFLLNPGDLMMMDNRRLLHGRTSFDTREGLRHLQGCYIDVDGPRSLYRVLRRNSAASGGQS
jgi:gamma-butyrobetaine dioxygenase